MLTIMTDNLKTSKSAVDRIITIFNSCLFYTTFHRSTTEQPWKFKADLQKKYFVGKIIWFQSTCSIKTQLKEN